MRPGNISLIQIEQPPVLVEGEAVGHAGAGVGLSAAFFGDPLTAARVLGGLIVLLDVILTRVALDRAARIESTSPSASRPATCRSDARR